MKWNSPARARRFLRHLAEAAAETLCPPLCAGCLSDLDSPFELLCAECRADLPGDGLGFCFLCGGGSAGRERHLRQRACVRPAHRDFRARCLYWMHGPVPGLVHQLKYRGVTRLADGWGAALGEWLRPGASAFRADFVAPVPMHRARLAARGYNQAALLARAAAGVAGLPCVEDALGVRRAAPSQTTLDPAGRRANLVGAFLVTRPALVAGRRVALVDDVVTTGATLGAATAALLEAGAAAVSAVAVARA